MADIIGTKRLQFGAYEVDLQSRELRKHGTRLKLAGQPFEILAFLVQRPNQLVTREELRAQLWPGDTFVDFNHSLNAAVNKLREALCDSADDPKFIETLPRRGYRFMAAVTPVPAATPANVIPPPTVAVTPVPAMTPPVPASSPSGPIPLPVDSSTPRKSGWLRPALIVASAVLVLGVIVNFDPLDMLRANRAERAAKAEKDFAEKGPHPFALTSLPESTTDAAFSPDGTRVAFRREGNSPQNSGIFIKPIDGSQILQLTDHAEDHSPVWSPDGTQIAFSRVTDKQLTIYTVDAVGGKPRKLLSGINSRHPDLDWSTDGQSLAFVMDSAPGTSSIFLLSLKDLSVRRISQPPPQNQDRGPAFSPDGQSLAFIRTHETGLPDTIVVMPSTGGESRVLVSLENGLLGSPAWTPDSSAIVFSAGTVPTLMRVPAFGSEELTELEIAGSPASHPAISRKADCLAFQRRSKAVSIWQTDLDGKSPTSHGLVVTDTGRNEGLQVSPDGKKLVFMSDRSGSLEIWTSDRDGSNPLRLTSMGDVGTPRWSPDGRTIAFDASSDGHGTIFLVDASGGPARPLVKQDSQNLVPNWSADGNWVYFASNRTGIWQVWKILKSGGVPVQVTTHGGFAAYEVGDILYYSKFNMPSPEIWQMPLAGGAEQLVFPSLRPDSWASWAPTPSGIFFVQSDSTGEAALMFLDADHQRVSKLASVAGKPFWLAATPDGKSAFYEHMDQESSRIMLIRNFQSSESAPR